MNSVDYELEKAVRNILEDEPSSAGEVDVQAARLISTVGTSPASGPPGPATTSGPSPTLSVSSTGSGGKNLAMVKRLSEDFKIQFSDDDEMNENAGGGEVDSIVLSSDDEDEGAGEKHENQSMRLVVNVKQEPMTEVTEQVTKLPTPAGNDEQVDSFVPQEVVGYGSGYVKFVFVLSICNWWDFRNTVAPVVISSDDEDEMAVEKRDHMMRIDSPLIVVKKEVVMLPMSARNPDKVGSFVPPDVGEFGSRYEKFIFELGLLSVIICNCSECMNADAPSVLHPDGLHEVPKQIPVILTVREERVYEGINAMPVHINASMEQPLHNTSTHQQPVHINASKPKPVHINATKPKPVHINATKPKPVHINATKPKPVHTSASKSKPVHINATKSKPVHNTSSNEQPVHNTSTNEQPVHIKTSNQLNISQNPNIDQQQPGEKKDEEGVPVPKLSFGQPGRDKTFNVTASKSYTSSSARSAHPKTVLKRSLTTSLGSSSKPGQAAQVSTARQGNTTTSGNIAKAGPGDQGTSAKQSIPTNPGSEADEVAQENLVRQDTVPVPTMTTAPTMKATQTTTTYYKVHPETYVSIICAAVTKSNL